MFTLAGLKPDYKFVPTGYGPGALIDGDVDALAGYLTDEVLSYKAAKGELARPADLHRCRSARLYPANLHAPPRR